MSLPSNVHVSQHPCLRAKLSQLRSGTTSSKEVKSLVHEIALIVGCEALAAAVSTSPGPKDKTPLGFEYETTVVTPETISIVPILRSGLGMVEAIQTLLPTPVPVHHLGLYREPTTLEPVEYYNNLPEHIASSSTSTATASLAIILDPVIATGGTCAAAIQTLREWGAERIVVLSVLGAQPGVQRAAAEWPQGVDIWLAAVDSELTPEGMLKPGLGDVGDRLFLTIGK
ncbi:PRTase-like protein [Cryphonectria parasitica EP155]|uniref:uracil phosphoribosyltransferase n=1 Tax=Cryphonectria parasitica (strain ATCC 38755 / EP155) TaxID=660469 RepID=A0A9P4YC20_CRYP1|nr:PRTase-like protein [Cryphonectria parasitica EP155]KAF3770318.1 PRTase-like protein [Cryphonectria parasitica EP155]